jgi:3D (Asp-Asp-Asp) domain-containing protein/septal ring factor EnvC (AmiA/AmiB activator)
VRTGFSRLRTRLAVAGLVALLGLFAASSALADDPAALRTEAERLRAESQGLRGEAQQALLGLYAIDSRLAGVERRLTALRARQAELQQKEKLARRRLELARADLDAAERRLAARLRTLYMQDEVDPLAVVLGAQSLDDALSALDDLGRVASLDRSIVLQLRRTRRAVSDSLARLSARRSELREVVSAVAAERTALVASRAEQRAYLADVRSRLGLNDRSIADLKTRASAAEEKAQTLASSGSHAQPPASPPSAGTHMTVASTGYCLDGPTATGVPVGWGVVAVDPAVIPLGTRIFVPGYGEGVAADTGGSVQGAVIDLWFPECSQAMAWGEKVMTITIY